MKKFAKTADLLRKVLKNSDLRSGRDGRSIVEPVESSAPRPIGIFRSRMISVPPLNEEDLFRLNSICHPTIVTRHIESRYLKDALLGYFRFGTTGGYRAGEQAAAVGRFSDLSEGRIRKTFNTATGYHETLQINGEELRGNFVSPNMDQVVYEERANDFCSCSTIGQFDKRRAESFRSKGNPRLGAFVSYDLVSLVSALRTVLHEREGAVDCGILVRPIEYKPKDFKCEIPERHRFEETASAIDRWLSISFIKPSLFVHEAELRILVFNRDRPGQLDEATQPIAVLDKLIADTIVTLDTFSAFLDGYFGCLSGTRCSTGCVNTPSC